MIDYLLTEDFAHDRRLETQRTLDQRRRTADLARVRPSRGQNSPRWSVRSLRGFLTHPLGTWRAAWTRLMF